MTLLATGITTYAVANELGVSTRNVGALCSSMLINPWSKWKPINYNGATLTLDILKRNNYGINVIKGSSPEVLFNLVKANSNLGYNYDKPTGGSTSPYRLGDYRNYYHNAIIPSDCSYNNNDVVAIGGVTSTNHNSYKKYLMGLEMDTSPINITNQDIYGNNVNLKRGALITDGTYTYWSTEYIPWAESQWQRFKGKTCTVFEFYTNTNNNPDYAYSANANDVFMALPDPIRTISVTNNAPAGSKDVGCRCMAEFRLIGTTSQDMRYVDYEVYFTAIDDVYKGGTITNVHIQLSKDSKGLNPIHNIKLADSITIPKGTNSTTYTGTMNNISSIPNLYVLVYWNNNLQYTTMVYQSSIQ